MEQVTEKFTSFLIQNGYIESSKKAWCIYLLQKKLLNISSTLIFLLIGFFKDFLIETFVFVFCFLKLRKRTGGIHFNSANLCLLVSSMIVLLLPNTIYYLNLLSKTTMTFLITISCYVIIKHSPVNHPNIHFSKQELYASKQYAITTLTLIMIFMALCFSLSIINLRYASICAIVLDAILIIFAKIIRQEVNTDEY